MRLDVVGMPVEPAVVVADHDPGAHLTDDRHQSQGRLVQVRLPETAGVVVAGQAHHAGVAPPARAAEEAVIGDAERGAGGLEFPDPVLAEQVTAAGGQVGQVRRDDLAQLAQRAGDQRHRDARRRVPGHGGAGLDRFVVGVGVHQQQPAPGLGGAHRERD